MKIHVRNRILPLIFMGLIVNPLFASRPYWQQDVKYFMDVRLRESAPPEEVGGRTLQVKLHFSYRNNSPDTLSELRFHAHYNAFQPGTPSHRRWQELGSRQIEDSPPEYYSSLTVHKVVDETGRALIPEWDFSIFRIPLPDPLPPGGETTLDIEFSSKIPGPGVAYRSAASYGQLKVAHWYPQVCVYDPVMGWVDNQYFGRGEAYGEFGVYDVQITLPEPYIVAATGHLQNRDEVFPDDLIQQLDLKKFANWPWGKRPEKIPGDWEKSKTWHFYAENVHDFAFVADPTFLIDQVKCGDTDIWIYARQEHASGWQDAAEVTRQGMEILEREIGPFPYSDFSVTDCFSGMEYPGIVFCGGSSPRYKLLFWHEMAHNYFMGAIGSNQTDRPFMDEGFTTYMEILIMEEILGMENLQIDHWGPWNITDRDRWYRGLRPYLLWQKSGYSLPLHIESDLPDVYLQYRVSAYYKPASMLFALRYLIGYEGMRKVFRVYYDEWKYRHPYEGDFFRTLEETFGVSYEWFYDSWIRGTKSLDYSIHSGKAPEHSMVVLRIRREGDMIMPVKVRVKNKTGDHVTYYIPIDVEPTPPDCEIRLPRWDQQRDPYREYSFTLKKDDFHSAKLDPQGLLADLNPLNNRTTFFPPIKWEFGYPLDHPFPVDAYQIRYSPTAFYNGVDGVQLGGYIKGDLLDEWSQLDLQVRVGTLSGAVSAEIQYDDAFAPLGLSTTWGFSGYSHEGHRGGEIRLQHKQKRGLDQPTQWRGGIKWFIHEMFDEKYLPDPVVWEEGIISSLSLNGGVFPSAGGLHFSAEASLEMDAPLSDFTFTRSSLEVTARYPLEKLCTFTIRSFLGSVSEDGPRQLWYGFSGGGPLLQAQSRWLRSWASLPPDWNASIEGEGNLRGYTPFGYVARNVATTQMTIYRQLGIVNSLIGKLHLPSRFRPSSQGFLFAGMGDFADVLDKLSLERRREAGFGLSFDFPAGSDISIAFPLYLSDPASDEQNWEWRTVIGFSLKKW